MTHRRKALCCGVALLALQGCAPQEDSDLHAWVRERKVMVKPYVSTLREPAAFTPQTYLAEHRSDPFDMQKLTQVLSRQAARKTADVHLLMNEQSRPKAPLERYSLDSMTMVGSLEQQGRATALLRIEQQIYQVRVGDYLGQNYGRVIQIQEHHIKLREVVQDPAGDWVERTATLDLQEGSK